jgi:hypothetical protein
MHYGVRFVMGRRGDTGGFYGTVPDTPSGRREIIRFGEQIARA